MGWDGRGTYELQSWFNCLRAGRAHERMRHDVGRERPIGDRWRNIFWNRYGLHGRRWNTHDHQQQGTQVHRRFRLRDET